MSDNLLDKIIEDFNINDLRSFLGGKLSGFRGEIMDYSDFLNVNQRQYSRVCKIGETTLKGNEHIIAIVAETADSLTERSGKKMQYEIAKTILKTEIADLAFFVFYDADGNFRFSIIHIQREKDKTHYSSFKRYTYYVSKDQTNKTFREQIGNSNFDSVDGIIKAFSVEKLNKEFYDELSNWYFWAKSKVKFPDDVEKNEEIRNAINVIRLITRLIFVWFLKQKKLIPNELFDCEEIKTIINFSDKTESTYYKAILQNLFFATLNTEMTENKRKFVNRQYGVQGFYRYERFFSNKERFLELTRCIPFLNGGLFENLDKNVGEPNELRVDCFSNRIDLENKLVVPDNLFFGETGNINLNEAYGDRNHTNVKVRGIIDILKSYNFTVEENNSIEVEVALDPELLGKVFENLLASYNPETQTTARKQSGSFYTPREIVDYMCDESLFIYLKEATKGTISDEYLRGLIAYNNAEIQLDDADRKLLIESIDKCKILDPACGSGAFPMGILQKLVFMLQKLDPKNQQWKIIQENRAKEENKEMIERLEKDKELVTHISSLPELKAQALKELELRLMQIEYAFTMSTNELDYARKLFLIENCIYGVDIQPIAIQISKLRFFISLLVEQEVNNKSSNRGIVPMPNMETKFVASNTLIKLNQPKQTLIKPQALYPLEAKLQEVRHRHFSARTPDTKKKYRQRDEELRKQIGKVLEDAGFPPTSAKQIAGWDPYNQNTFANWFDSKWMFGVEKFDIIIGNPPWGAKLTSYEKELFKEDYKEIDSSTPNSFAYFVGLAFKNYATVISYVLPDSILIKDFKKTRKLIKDNLREIHWYENSGLPNDLKPFVYVDHDVCVLIISSENQKNLNYTLHRYNRNEKKIIETSYEKKKESIIKKEFEYTFNLLVHDTDLEILNHLEKLQEVGNVMQCHEGIRTGNSREVLFSDINRNQYCKPLYYGGGAGDVINNYYSRRFGWFVDYRTDIIDKSRGLYASLRNENIFIFPKIYITRTGNPFKAFYDDNAYASNNFFSLQHKNYSENTPEFLKSILPFIISKVAQYYIRKFAAPRLGNTFVETKIYHLLKFKIPHVSETQQELIITLVDIIIFLKNNNNKEISTTVSNEIIANYFEKVIDACVYELYFEDEIKSSNTDVLSLLQEALSKLVALPIEEQISQLYSELNDYKNEIRNRIILQETRSESVSQIIKSMH
ncbi:MAG: Eco57I restriction-modification methylase domain-containing protein [Prevotella sp.]|jgi:hypothetical protein|nr:Eco57I restriction-modification methylase domain-containing protein [Prevotella sp.]